MENQDRVIKCIAWDLIAKTYLYDKINIEGTHAVQVGNGRVLYTGAWKSTQSDNIKLQRLEEVEFGLKKHTRYIDPDKEVSLIPESKWDQFEEVV